MKTRNLQLSSLLFNGEAIESITPNQVYHKNYTLIGFEDRAVKLP